MKFSGQKTKNNIYIYLLYWVVGEKFQFILYLILINPKVIHTSKKSTQSNL